MEAAVSAGIWFSDRVGRNLLQLADLSYMNRILLN